MRGAGPATDHKQPNHQAETVRSAGNSIYWPVCEIVLFGVEGSRWRVSELSYRVSNYPARLPAAQVDTEIAAALQVWAAVTDLTFKQKQTGKVKLDLFND